jgi:predicted Zn-dependent peptidase
MIINKTNQTALSGFYIVYKGSTNLEKKGWYGLSHLMEHLKCKCFDDLMDAFQEDAISWNAYTANNKIVFYFQGLERCLAKYRDIIIERMYLPFEKYITQEELDNEIKIVLKEYNQSFTSQDETFFQNYMRRNYSFYSPIGLREDIENTTYQDCLDFYDIQYKYPDCIINISKDFEYENENLEFTDRSDSLKSDWSKNPDIKIETPIQSDNTIEIVFDQTIDSNDIPHIKIINSLLTSGLNSPFYQEIREKRALCYGIGNYIVDIGDLNVLMINVMTSPENVPELEEGLNEILDNKEKYLTQERLDVVKNGSLISKEKSEINAHTSINNILDPNVDKVYEIIEDIKLEEVYEVYDKYFSLDKFEKITDKDIVE